MINEQLFASFQMNRVIIEFIKFEQHEKGNFFFFVMGVISSILLVTYLCTFPFIWL